MKILQLFLITIVIACAIFCIAAETQAATAWYTCQVNEVGPGVKFVRINLSDLSGAPVFTQKWFKFPDIWKKEMLALALTAVSFNKNIKVQVDINSASTPKIVFLYLVN